MSSPKLAPPLAGNVIGTGNDAFVIAEWRDPGGPPGSPRYIAPLHVHRRDDKAGTCWRAVCASWLESGRSKRKPVPLYSCRAEPHTLTGIPVRSRRDLLVMTSNIHRLIQEIHGLKERTPAALRAVFEKYDSELLG